MTAKRKSKSELYADEMKERVRRYLIVRNNNLDKEFDDESPGTEEKKEPSPRAARGVAKKSSTKERSR
jgi:hypothetical protein